MLIRKILPLRWSRFWARNAFAAVPVELLPSPALTYSLPSGPKARWSMVCSCPSFGVQS